MSKAQLKKTLAGMEAKEIAEMVCELYDARPEAKEYLEFWLNPDVGNELEKYKVKIYRLFYTASGKQRKRPTQTAIKKELKYFSTICYDPEAIAELYIYLCETDLQWLREKRNPAPYIKSAKALLELCRKHIDTAGLEERYGIKLERLEEGLTEEEERGSERRRYGRFRWRW